MQQEKDKANKKEKSLGRKAFDDAMKTLGYKCIIHNGVPSMAVNAAPNEMMGELGIVLTNIYVTMLVLAVESESKEKNLQVSKRFLECTQEYLQSTTIDIMDKMLNEEVER